MNGIERFVRTSLKKIAAEKNLDRAIHLSRFLGEVLWKNSTSYYQLVELERELVERIESKVPIVEGSHRCCYGHVLTKAYDTGGHTRVVERLITSNALQDSAVLVLDAATGPAQERLSRARHGCTVMSSMGPGLNRISALVAEFIRFETIILYLHPHDIESVVAAGIASRRKGTKILFYNHADHVFSYGYGVADRVLEISHFGWALRDARGCLDRSVFAGIPLELPSKRRFRASTSDRQQGSIVAAGTAYKFKPVMGWSFPDFVRAICLRTNSRVEVVGPSFWRDWWWWPIMYSQRGRFAVHARLEHKKYLEFMESASAYVDSFPIVGGTAFAEVMGQGIPCFGVLTGSHGYSPADLVKSASVDELISDLLNFEMTGVKAGPDESSVFEQVRKIHDVEEVALRVAGAFSKDRVGIGPPWPCEGKIDTEYFKKMWMESFFPIVPVHVLPPFELILAFVLIKKRS